MANTGTAVRPFGMRDKLGYMFGDFGNDFTFMLSSSFMMVFYTDIMGVPSAIVGLLMMVARFADAFTDSGPVVRLPPEQKGGGRQRRDPEDPPHWPQVIPFLQRYALTS